MDLYIYYRVAVAEAAVLRAKVLTMQDNLARLHGIRTALKRRPEEQDGKHTWMEVYLDVPAAFAAELEQAVQAQQLWSLIDGKRHTEQFLDLSLCA
ncbi:hypothetical protein D3C72_68740 [compost metagenome]